MLFYWYSTDTNLYSLFLECCVTHTQASLRGKWRVKSNKARTKWKPASLGAGWLSGLIALVQTTRLTGGHDLYKSYNFRITFPNAREARINNVILWNVKVIFLINSIKIRNTIGYIMYLSPHIDSSIIWMIISSIDVFCNGVS